MPFLRVLLASALLVATAGCSAGGTMSAGQAQMPSGSSQAMTMKKVPGLQTCGLCGAKTEPVVVEGAAVLDGGSQTVNISITDGVYMPNRITASAGTPIKVVFTASTPCTGCVAVPTFKTLSKSGNAKSGPAVIDLGTLQPGTYAFGCKMGSHGGDLIVR